MASLGASVLPGSPNRKRTRGPSSAEFAEQIRQLELEGEMLRTAGSGSGKGLVQGNVNVIASPPTVGPSCLSSSIPGIQSSIISGRQTMGRPQSSLQIGGVGDSSAEHNTVSQLRSQLQHQQQEMERLQRTLLTDRSSVFSGVLPVKSAVTDLESPGPKSHLETALKHSQDQVVDLKQRLSEAHNVGEEQKKQFRTTIEELQSKLQAVTAERDMIMAMRKTESESQETLIRKLQATLQQLQDAMRQQEEALLESTSKLDSVNQNLYVSEASLNQVRHLVAEVEKKRGKAFYDSEPITNQSGTMVVHTLERCLQEFEGEIEIQCSKVRQLQTDLDEVKRLSQASHHELVLQHQQRLTQVTEEQERQLEAAAERAGNARKQTTNLQTQLKMLQEQMDGQLAAKDEHVRDLELKVNSLKEGHDGEKRAWSEKREALEQAMDDTQKELSSMRSERDEAVQKAAILETRTEDFQLTITKLEEELDTEREQVRKMFDRDDESNKKMIELESKLHNKDLEIESLEKMCDTVKAECELTLQSKISSAEREERIKAKEEINSLTSQINSVTEKYNKSVSEVEFLKTEFENSKKQISGLTEKLQENKINLDQQETEKTNMAALLEDRIADCDRLTKERDYYFNLLEERNEELKGLTGQKEQLAVKLEERERNLMTLQQQTDNISQIVQVNTKNTSTVTEERERLMKLLNEKTVEIEQLKHSQQNVTRKLRIREKRLKELETDVGKLKEEIGRKAQDLEEVEKEKEGIFHELKDSRYEVANLVEERDALKKNLEDQGSELEKEISRLTQKYKTMEQDLRLARKTLKSNEAVGGKAVKVAGKMQKEVTAKRSEIDTLKSKVHWLEECLDAALRDKKTLKDEREKLSASLSKSSRQNEKLSENLESHVKKSQDLRLRVTKLEGALEKAAVKHAGAVAEIERMEQEMARMKLRHQLELKDQERSVQSAGKSPQDRLQPHVTANGRLQSRVKSSDRLQGHVMSGDQLQHHVTSGDRLQYCATSGDWLQPHVISSDRLQPQVTSSDRLQSHATSAYQWQPQVTPGERPQSHESPNGGYHFQPPPGQGHSSQGHVSVGSVDEVPVLQRPESSQSAVANNAVGEELKQLLGEMRTLITTAQQQQSPANTRPPTHQSPDQDSHSETEADQSVVNGNTEHGRQQGTPLLASSPVHSGVSKKSSADGRHTMQASPIHGISQERHYRRYDTGSSSVPSTVSSSYPSDALYRQGPARGAPGRVTSDAQELCKRLEEKIEKLSKMGGHLQQENKDMAALIKDQGKRLKRVKESEKSVNKILKK